MTIKIDTIPYCCPSCGSKLGEMFPQNGRVALDAGGWGMYDGFRYCHRCGRLIHFKEPKEAWALLVERYQKVKEACV